MQGQEMMHPFVCPKEYWGDFDAGLAEIAIQVRGAQKKLKATGEGLSHGNRVLKVRIVTSKISRIKGDCSDTA
jgi:hypothetical protein